MKVMLVLCLLVVIFALVFPVAAAWSPGDKAPDGPSGVADKLPESPASDGLFYVEDRPQTPDRTMRPRSRSCGTDR